MPDNTNVSRRTAGPTELAAAEPRLLLNETDATATEQLWDIVATGDQLLIRTRTDADGAGATILTVDRAGTAVSSLSFGGDLIFATDNADDIGASAATRPRAGYFGTFLAIGTNPATSGPLRLPNNTSMYFRNAANSADVVGFTINGANRIVIGDSGDTGISVNASAGNTIVMNDGGLDTNFLVESDTNATHFISTAGSFSGAGSISQGAAALTTSYNAIQRPALTAGANLNYFDLNVAPAGAVTIPTGTAAIVAGMNIEEPNITATGTVSDAYTLRIAAAPTEGTRNGALWADAGVSRFDDSILIGGTAIDNGTNQLNVYNGTVPTTVAADSITLYSTDDTAGNTIPSFRCEGTGVLATAQADSASSVRVKMRINGTVVTLLAI